MKRRISVLLALIVWILIGKAMAQAQNHSALAVNKCDVDMLARNMDNCHFRQVPLVLNRAVSRAE